MAEKRRVCCLSFHNFCSYILNILIIASVLLLFSTAENSDSEKWKKKDVRDYTDADLERLYDQWEDNDDEPLPQDELPEWKQPEPKIDLSQLDPNNPEAMLQAAKKGRTLMMFVSVSGDGVTEKETEKVTSLWQSNLFNANYEMQRFVVSDNRVVFMLKDGSKAWEIKDYLIQQECCESVTLEGNDYIGKGHKDWTENSDKKSEDDKKKATKNKQPKKKKSDNEANLKSKRKEEL